MWGCEIDMVDETALDGRECVLSRCCIQVPLKRAKLQLAFSNQDHT